MTVITSSITYVITLVFTQSYDDRLNECHYPIGLIAQQFFYDQLYAWRHLYGKVISENFHYKKGS